MRLPRRSDSTSPTRSTVRYQSGVSRRRFEAGPALTGVGQFWRSGERRGLCGVSVTVAVTQSTSGRHSDRNTDRNISAGDVLASRRTTPKRARGADMGLQIGETAPDFEADTTQGRIKF